MKREPSIHITKTSLIEILKDLVITGPSRDYKEEAKFIFSKAKSLSLSTRSVTITNKQLEKKANRLIQSSRQDADLFAQLIFATRKKMKHRGITPIKPGGKDWDVIKEITAHALNFCIANDLTKRAGFLKYIEIGLGKIKKYSLVKFPSLQETIHETYQAIHEVEMDDNSEETDELYRVYFAKILENTGITDNSKEMPEKYVWFVRARKAASEMNVKVKDYIDAQFEALDFARGIPHPTQLIGPKAKERVIRYLYKNNININKKSKNQSNWLDLEFINNYGKSKTKKIIKPSL